MNVSNCIATFVNSILILQMVQMMKFVVFSTMCIKKLMSFVIFAFNGLSLSLIHLWFSNMYTSSTCLPVKVTESQLAKRKGDLMDKEHKTKLNIYSFLILLIFLFKLDCRDNLRNLKQEDKT